MNESEYVRVRNLSNVINALRCMSDVMSSDDVNDYELQEITSRICKIQDRLFKNSICDDGDKISIPEDIWNTILKTSKECRKSWGMGFECISISLLMDILKRKDPDVGPLILDENNEE